MTGAVDWYAVGRAAYGKGEPRDMAVDAMLRVEYADRQRGWDSAAIEAGNEPVKGDYCDVCSAEQGEYHSPSCTVVADTPSERLRRALLHRAMDELLTPAEWAELDAAGWADATPADARAEVAELLRRGGR